MRIDGLMAILLAAVAFSSIPLASSEYIIIHMYKMSCMRLFMLAALDPGLVGLALTYTVSLSGMFQFCVRLSADVENTVSGGLYNWKVLCYSLRSQRWCLLKGYSNIVI